jgi:hypothetical protein
MPMINDGVQCIHVLKMDTFFIKKKNQTELYFKLNYLDIYKIRYCILLVHVTEFCAIKTNKTSILIEFEICGTRKVKQKNIQNAKQRVLAEMNLLEVRLITNIY